MGCQRVNGTGWVHAIPSRGRTGSCYGLGTGLYIGLEHSHSRNAREHGREQGRYIGRECLLFILSSGCGREPRVQYVNFYHLLLCSLRTFCPRRSIPANAIHLLNVHVCHLCLVRAHRGFVRMTSLGCEVVEKRQKCVSLACKYKYISQQLKFFFFF